MPVLSSNGPSSLLLGLIGIVTLVIYARFSDWHYGTRQPTSNSSVQDTAKLVVETPALPAKRAA